MKNILKILLMSSFLITLAGGLLGPIYAIFVKEIGGNLITAGGAYAIFSISSGILIFIFAKLEDKIKHQEYVLIFGRVISVIGFIGYLFVQNPIHLFIVQAIFGIATAVKNPVYDSLYSKNLQKGKFASQWGTFESMSAITIGIAAITGSLIAQKFGFKTLFIVMLAFSILSLLSTLLLIKKIKEYLK